MRSYVKCLLMVSYSILISLLLVLKKKDNFDVMRKVVFQEKLFSMQC